MPSERKLIEGPKKDKVLESSRPVLTVSVKTLEAEQTADSKRKAIRLFCRAMIRLYLRDNKEPDIGNSLGIL
jgi:hypothetical protein